MTNWVSTEGKNSDSHHNHSMKHCPVNPQISSLTTLANQRGNGRREMESGRDTGDWSRDGPIASKTPFKTGCGGWAFTHTHTLSHTPTPPNHHQPRITQNQYQRTASSFESIQSIQLVEQRFSMENPNFYSQSFHETLPGKPTNL